MQRNVVKAVGLILVVLFAVTGCGGGGGTEIVQSPQPVQKVSAVDGSWDDVTGAQMSGNNFKLYGNVDFSNGKVRTVGYLGPISVANSLSKTGTFSITDNNLSYTFTSSYWGLSSSAISESVTCNVTLSGNQMVLKNTAGNQMIFKKSGTDGMGLTPIIRDATITPAKIANPYTTTQTPAEISVTILDSGADIDLVTVDFYSGDSTTKDVNNPSVTVHAQASGLTKATVSIPCTITTLPTSVSWEHMIKITAYDTAGNVSNTKVIYISTI